MVKKTNFLPHKNLVGEKNQFAASGVDMKNADFNLTSIKQFPMQMAMSTGNYKNNRKASDVVSLNFALRICKKKFLQELSQPPLWLMASGLSSKTLTTP